MMVQVPVPRLLLAMNALIAGMAAVSVWMETATQLTSVSLGFGVISLAGVAFQKGSA
jgi:hypothetical protein